MEARSPLSYATFPAAVFAPSSPGSLSVRSAATHWQSPPERAFASGGGGGGGGGPGSPGGASALQAASMGVTSVGELVDKALNRTAAVQVVLRIRPMSVAELQGPDPEPCLRAAQDHRQQYRHLEAVVNRDAKEEVVTRFTFDRVLPPEVGQRELFELSGVRELMDAALTGINVSVFAYGQTGSGKTYTMSGLEENLMRGYNGDDSSLGIISRAVSYLFQRIEEDVEGSTTVLKAAFSEIYNERVYDLLNVTGELLHLGYHAETKSVFMQGQVLVDCENVSDVMAVVREGHSNRTVASHALNNDSSRSHSILQLTLQRSAIDAETGDVVRSRAKIMFIDLAGSERLKQSQSTGHTAVESRYINKSLSTLGRVIAALSDPSVRASRAPLPPSAAGGGGGGGTSSAPRGPGDYVIPYRESMLTRLLQDSLGGSALTVMIACVSPAARYLQESLMTLNYAARASHIENAPVIHVDGKDALLMGLKRELRHARIENAALRGKLSLPAEGPVLDLLASMPVLVPVDSVLVAQAPAAPTAEVSAQTEPLHPSHLFPRPPNRVPREATDAAGKGTLGGRQRGRLASGQTSKGASTWGSNLGEEGEGGGGGGSGSGSSGAPSGSPLARGTLHHLHDHVAGGGALGGSSSSGGGQRLSERLVDRAGRQLVLDMQQSELAVLGEEKEALKAKCAAAQARMAVLVKGLEEARSAGRRLERELEEAQRARGEAERTVSRVLTGAAAAGWPLPFALDPPLGSAAPGVVPLSAGAAALPAPHAHPLLYPHPLAAAAGGEAGRGYLAAAEASARLQAELEALGGGGGAAAAEAQLRAVYQGQEARRAGAAAAAAAAAAAGSGSVALSPQQQSFLAGQGRWQPQYQQQQQLFSYGGGKGAGGAVSGSGGRAVAGLTSPER